MRAKTLLIVAAVAVILAIPSLLRAHHGSAIFDTQHLTTVKGTITEFEWTNPHAYLHFDVRTENGNVEQWSGEMASLGTLTRLGWKKDTLRPGDQITATGNRSKDAKPFMHVVKVIVPSGEELTGNLF